ncbi:MAG TPA: VWA domain-containing protein [Pyrinomonadaceae bacterium]|jgi:VWFA-related protein|nr:VWA domain-containing protein [Pyrinomonadaceae bacterium]
MILSSNFPDKLRKIVCAVAAALCLCSGASVRAQQGQDEPVEPIYTNLVILNVGVADRKGGAVTDLSRNDFNVYEDGVKQSIVNFEPAASPFSLVLLLDMSGSTLNFRPTLIQSALRFVDALGPEDRVEVVSFNEKVQTLQRFTSDRKKIAFAINEANGRGQTYLYKALDYSLQQLAKEGKRRKAIVVLSDGLDTEMSNLDRESASKAGTNEEAVAAVKPEGAAALRSVLDAADRQGVTIYPLALPSADPTKLLPLTPQQAAIYTAARARMQSLADRTGGRLHEIRRLEDMGRLYAEVAADMRTLYSIAYQSSNARAHDGKWRAINIEVTRAETIARSRPGYYAR